MTSERTYNGSSADSACNPAPGTVARVDMFIDDIDFPCNKDDLIEHAKSNGAPKDVLQLLDQFPDKEYASTFDLARGARQLMH